MSKRCIVLGNMWSKNSCFNCKKDGCNYKHYLIDSSVFLETLEGDEAANCGKIINRVNRVYRGYVDIHVFGEIMKKLVKEQGEYTYKINPFIPINILEGLSPQFTASIKYLLDNLKNFQFIESDKVNLDILNNLKSICTICGDRDKRIISSAIHNKIDLITLDPGFKNDEENIRKVCSMHSINPINIYHLKKDRYILERLGLLG